MVHGTGGMVGQTPGEATDPFGNRRARRIKMVARDLSSMDTLAQNMSPQINRAPASDIIPAALFPPFAGLPHP
jgi:hypothetical protein